MPENKIYMKPQLKLLHQHKSRPVIRVVFILHGFLGENKGFANVFHAEQVGIKDLHKL